MGSQYEPLSAADERRALLQWRAGDARAADVVITRHQRLVVRLAHRYATYGVPVDDLVQEGNIGLLRALRKFDLERGVRFMTFGMWWARAYMVERVRRDVSLVRHPVKQQRPARDASLDVGYLDSGEMKVDRLADDTPDIESIKIAGQSAQQVHAAVKGLNRRERDIIARRFLADEPETLQAIAATYRLSRERVRQLEARALKKLRFRLTA